MSRIMQSPPGDIALVSIINTAYLLDFPTDPYFKPSVPGFTQLNLPCYAFLIESRDGRKILFDLGLRTDWRNLAPSITKEINDYNINIQIQNDAVNELETHGIRREDIEAVVLSHSHWDHVGDMSLFPSSTKIIVGPGYIKEFIPGWPINPKSPLLVSDYEGKSIQEVEFEDDQNLVSIGGFTCYDYFRDGSFYIIDAPGHSVGHICGLARTSTSPDSFLFMGADICHHNGELRPSELQPIPRGISLPYSLKNGGSFTCPGSMFERHLRCVGRGPTSSFFDLPEDETFTMDMSSALVTLEKLKKVDGYSNVFVVLAHDDSINSIVNFFPERLNDWKRLKWDEASRWAFLNDLQGCAD